MDERERAAQLQLVMQGDADALQRLVVHYHTPLRGVLDAAIEPELRRYVDPDDVLQQTYIAAFRSMEQCSFDGPGSFYKWLEAIALHRLKDAQRALRRQKRDVGREIRDTPDRSASYPDLIHRLAGGESTPSRLIGKEEAVAAMMSCLARLSDEQRQVVRLRFLEDVPVAEIARRLGKTNTAVYTLCHRGLKSLRERMVSITRYLTKL